ncbi:penicillin-binding transpeptidase domain-containing protein [Salirhabdus sp. Marseille-P4669]|uniref:penicillin-binding transpeptidase domain-containing protein n=1 Tax=Salirhabdus sp. Marseille-P4669 TaxID=2042310 RepID=UPI000C7D21B6|nr:penicillin-binding transpeptidase domain-containing protein [Salirhabdus sp. Marseille-P4669]
MKKLKATNGVAILFIVGFSILFLVLFGRIMYIQASGEIEGVNLEEWAEKQRTSSYPLSAERGLIYDRSGMVLAANRPVYRLYAILDEEYTTNEKEPLHVKDPFNTANKLAPYLGLEESALADTLNSAIEDDKFQVEFTNRSFTEEEKKEIEKLDLPGIYFSKHSERYYPNSQFASHVIGFTQKKEDTLEGAMGIEASFNDVLTGKPGKISYQRDRYATKLLNPEEAIVQAEDGDNVYLTIDQKIQTFLEDAMTEVQEQYEPEKIMAVVMNPKTGEVLAMSNRPSFDPNVKENIENWYNDIIAYPFEPGSTMKIFTVAAAIDSGNYNGDELFESGTYQYLDNVRPVHDHNWGKGWDYITYDEGFTRSSNVAMAKLVWEKMGTETFLEYLQKFHFDQKTNIDLAGETKGTILYNWPSEKVTTSYGQGTTVTPMQLMKAATAIVNDGKMMKPYVISKIEDADTGKVIKESEPEVVGQPISKDTAKQVMTLMEGVVNDELGTGYGVYTLDDYSVAGKTGTAQIPDPETGRYLTGRENYVFSFLGMAPSENPELMMFVAVERPKLEDTEAGSEPVSYIFKTVMENSLKYLEIKPDKESTALNVNPFPIPSSKGASVDAVVQNLQELGLDTKVIGNGSKVDALYPNEGMEVVPGASVMIRTDGNVTMPDLTGWSLREVIQLGELLDIKVDYLGSGFTVKQSIAAGSEFKGNNYLSIELKAPNPSNETVSDEEGTNQEETSEDPDSNVPSETEE